MSADELDRRERLRAVTDRYWPVDGEDSEAVIASESSMGDPAEGFVTVTRDEDGEYFLTLCKDRDAILERFVDEVQGERSWWPVAAYDLDTGERLNVAVTVSATFTDDPLHVGGEDLFADPTPEADREEAEGDRLLEDVRQDGPR